MTERGPADPEWHVDIHRDDLNRFPGVAYVLRHVCGVSAPSGVALADEAQRHGTARVLSCVSRDHAEGVAAEIQLLGVRATVTGAERGDGPADD